MPAVSKAQRRFFGHLKSNPAEARRRGITLETVSHYVSTPERGLPERVTSRPRAADTHTRRGYRRID